MGELVIVVLALLLGACQGSPAPSAPAHQDVGYKKGRWNMPVLPIVDCEGLVFEDYPADEVLRIRLGSHDVFDHGVRCSARPLLLDDAFSDAKRFARLTGCRDCILERFLGMYVRQSTHYIRYRRLGVILAREYPFQHYSDVQIQAARFLFHRPGGLRQQGRLDYRCPHSDPDYYDEACLVFSARPPGQSHYRF